VQLKPDRENLEKTGCNATRRNGVRRDNRRDELDGFVTIMCGYASAEEDTR